MEIKLIDTLIEILKLDTRFVTDEGELLKNTIREKAEELDKDLIGLLLDEKTLREKFFVPIKDVIVFDCSKFIKFINNKEFLPDSFTSFKNKIGLTNRQGDFIASSNEVVLSFPYKDCVLVGGQDKEDSKREEVFYNEILGSDDIDRFLDEKVFTDFKRIDMDGGHELKEFKRDTEINKVRGFSEDTITDNLIIKGNNLLALHSLKKNFAGKVKLIYIDPPYNTGNDGFKYNDRFNHSTWLTFMKNRLEIARELLKDDGVMFVQCDDNEQAYLKVLMDEVFGRESFINIISAKMKNIAGASGGGEDKRLKKNIEFLNVFAKNYNNLRLTNTYEYTEISKLVDYYKSENISWKYTSVLIDEGKEEYIKSTKDGEGNEIKIFKRIAPIFKSVSQIAKEEKTSEKEVYYKYIDKIFTTAMPQSSIRTRVLESMSEEVFDFISIEYIPRSGKNKGKSYIQYYKGDKMRLLTWLKDVVSEVNGELYKKDLQGTFWDGFNLNNLTKEGDTLFDFGKKPEELVKKVIDISTEPGDIVLDYHLGSGTTCAVAHKMGRQYIGVEQMDYIENISMERMKKVIEGEQGGISKVVNWQGGGEFIYMSLLEQNGAYIEKIMGAKTSKELVSIWEEIKETGFVNYYVNTKSVDENIEEFQKLDVDSQKEFLISILDKNLLYQNYSEIDDKNNGITTVDKTLNDNFYKG